MIKSIVRFAHIFGVIVLSGIMLTEYFFYPNNKPQNDRFRSLLIAISTILLIVGGVINLLLLRNFKEKCDKKYYKLWAILTHTKLLFTLIFFSPFGKIILKDNILKSIRVILIFIFIIVAVFSKNLRELS